MTDKYKIEGIWYTKPVCTRDAKGEAVFGRAGLNITTGTSMSLFGKFASKITAIDFEEDCNEFYIHYENGGLMTIPKLEDTEVFYMLEKTK